MRYTYTVHQKLLPWAAGLADALHELERAHPNSEVQQVLSQNHQYATVLLKTPRDPPLVPPESDPAGWAIPQVIEQSRALEHLLQGLRQYGAEGDREDVLLLQEMVREVNRWAHGIAQGELASLPLVDALRKQVERC